MLWLFSLGNGSCMTEKLTFKYDLSTINSDLSRCMARDHSVSQPKSVGFKS